MLLNHYSQTAVNILYFYHTTSLSIIIILLSPQLIHSHLNTYVLYTCVGLQQQLQQQHQQQQQHQFRWQCSNIAQSLPDNYEITLEMLKDYLTDDQICRVLSSPNSSVPNSVILDCLMEKNTTIQFCELLEIITPISSKPELLLAFINNVKTSKINVRT